MKKAAIVTIISRNYGNRLQNFALQTTLEKIGIEAETMPTDVRHDTLFYAKLFVKSCLNLLNYKYESVPWDYFDLKIHWAKITEKNSNISDLYDYFIAGSDQIWNPIFDFNSSREFLPFAKPKQRIAYAASIGLEHLPKEYHEMYKTALEEFHRISMREYAGAQIVYALIKKEAPVVLDPTMLLSDAEWLNAVKRFKVKVDNKYIVKYFLGIQDDTYDKYIQDYANSKGYLVIDIMQPSNDLKGKVGPGEFVNLIANSRGVFTDSFHGTVFSIIFQRPFVVFSRPFESGCGEMNSRLDTLLKTFDFEDRRIRNINELQEMDFDCDFQTTTKLLERKKKEAIAYLIEAFDMEDQNENRTHAECET